MNTYSDRIAARMKELNLSQAAIAQATGAARSTVHGWLNNVAQPSGQRLLALAKILEVSTYWLLTGVDEETQQYENEALAGKDMMLQVALKQILGQPLDKPLDISSVSDESLRKMVESFEEIDDWDNNTPLPPDEVEIPFFKDFQMACGEGSVGEALRTEKRKLRFSKLTLNNAGVQKHTAIAVTAQGTSMHPVIIDKATVFLDTSRTKIRDGKIFAMCHGGLFKIKYLYALPFGGVRVVSENSEEYPEERLTAQEIEEQEFHIIGQVFSVSTMFQL